jgi:hypothetical protein
MNQYLVKMTALLNYKKSGHKDAHIVDVVADYLLFDD